VGGEEGEQGRSQGGQGGRAPAKTECPLADSGTVGLTRSDPVGE